MRDLAFLAAWLLLLPMALQGAQLGVLLWAWTSLLAPNDVLYGIAVGVPFAKVAAIVTIGLALFGRGGNIRLRFNATVQLMLGLVLVGLVAQANGVAADTSLGWDLYWKYAKILLLGVMVTAVMRDRLRLHALLLAICLGIGFTGLGEGMKFLLSGAAHKVLGTNSTGDNNQIGLDVLLIMPLLYYLHGTARLRALRVACIAVLGMCVLCVIATSSRAAFVGLVLLGVAYVLASRRKLMGLVVVGVLAFAGSYFVNGAYVARMNTIQTAAQSDDSFIGRVGAWKVSTVLALDRPLVGGGFHAIQNGDVWNAYRDAAGRMAIMPNAQPSETTRAAHSIYFEVLGDLGFTGIALFLALFWVALHNARTIRRRIRRAGREDLEWARSLAGALQTSVVVFLIGGASLSAAYYDIDYLLVAMLAVLREIVEQAVGATADREVTGPRPLTFPNASGATRERPYGGRRVSWRPAIR